MYDAETGWYYLQSRYYNPETCRFISADVLLSTGQGVIGNNSYAYCGNNPICRSDTAGNAWWSWVIGISLSLSIVVIADKVISSLASSDLPSAGSTGRAEPDSLLEQLAMEQTRSNPLAGGDIPICMKDPRWSASCGWVKKQQIFYTSQGKIIIHYNYNYERKVIDDLKFLTR